LLQLILNFLLIVSKKCSGYSLHIRLL
jgi:hypothetical protein